MAVQYKDYYQTLGVPKTATKDEIRSAFRKLARVHHPDVAKDKKTAEAKFKEINEAYEVLGDPEKRQKYDALGADWDRPQAGGPGGGGGRRRQAPGADPFAGMGGGGGAGPSFGGTGFSDFFEQFFSGRAGQQRPGANPFSGMGGGEPENFRGEDIEADLLVTLEEAFHGGKKKISFRRAGSERVETYEVRIPTGVREGQRIRLAGQGGTAGRGRPPGDLLLRVVFERHPNYRIEGFDLIYDLEVPAWKAVLGAEIEVPTPEGSVKLKIPSGLQPGRRFRLKGRGLPTSATTRGDFYVKLNVTLPTTVSAEERELWEKLAATWK